MKKRKENRKDLKKRERGVKKGKYERGKKERNMKKRKNGK